MDYRGWWNDGQSAGRLEVRVRLLGPRLLVSTADNDAAVAELSLAGLALAEEVYARQPVRLKHDEWPDARLTVADHALMTKLIAAEPRLGHRYHGDRGTLHRLAIWGGGLLAVVAALVGVVQFGAEPLAAAIPQEWEKALGEGLMADFIEHYGLCDGEPGAGHVQALTDVLASAPGSPHRFRVHVLDGAEVNAFALPGGYVAVFRGLLERADGPGELAGVLAHEVAHGLERHPTEQLVRRSGFSLLTGLIAGDASGFAVLAGDVASFMADMANSRADEREADRLAMALLNDAGMDSRGLPRFFEKLQSEDGDLPQALALVSTHPASEARLAETQALARAGADPMTEEAWLAVKRACDGAGT